MAFSEEHRHLTDPVKRKFIIICCELDTSNRQLIVGKTLDTKQNPKQMNSILVMNEEFAVSLYFGCV